MVKRFCRKSNRNLLWKYLLLYWKSLIESFLKRTHYQ